MSEEIIVFDSETQAFLQEREQVIGVRAKRMNDDIVTIGYALLEVRDFLDNKYGEYRGRILFGQWAETKVPFSRRTINRFIQIVERWGNNIPVPDGSSDLGFVALSELVQASDTIVEQVQTGEIAPTWQAIREAKRAERYTDAEVEIVEPLIPEPGPVYGTPWTRELPREYTSSYSPPTPYTPPQPSIPDVIREQRRLEAQARIEELRERGADTPVGIYSTLVVDPPWPMQKIERDVRPNQVEFDYPTMSEEELFAFHLPDMAAENCHLYLWVTQKHLPLGLRLAEHWGFKYQCILTWVKNVGFTPFSWMYSTEHVLFCTKGSLPLLELGKRLDFETIEPAFRASVREHSRKPDVFYELVKMVSPGPRLDVFSREKHEGFDQYGNEVEKYV